MNLTSSSLEILEDRIAPAALTVTYNATTGALEITADNDAQNVYIHAVGKNTFRIDGTNSTVDGTETFLDIVGKLTSIKYTGGDNYDRLTLFNLPTLNTFEFNGGLGDDRIDAYEFSAKGLTKINFGGDGGSSYFHGLTAKFGGNLEIDMAAGGDFTSEALKTTIAGSVTITGSQTAISYFELGGDVTTVAKGITWNGGSAEEHLHLFSAVSTTIGKNPATGKAIAFTGGGGEDLLEGHGNLIKLGGAVDFSGGTGEDEIDFGPLTIQIDGDFTFDGGDNDDFVTIGPGALKVAGNVTFHLGAGINEVDMYGRMTIGKNFTINGGADENYIEFDGSSLTVKGLLEINGGDIFNDITLVTETLQLGALKITAGSGDNNVLMGGFVLKVAGTTEINLAGDNNFFETDYDTSATFAKTVTLTGGDGTIDQWELDADKLTLGGNLVTNLGDGSNTFSLSAYTAKLAGSFTYTGDVGSDNVIFSGSVLAIAKEVTFTGGDGPNNLAFATAQISLKNVTVTGGADMDVLAINAIKLTTAGALTLQGNAGPDSFSISANYLTGKGNLILNGGDGEDNFSVIADGTLTGDILVDLGVSDTGYQDAYLASRSLYPGKLKIVGNFKASTATTDTTAQGYTDGVSITNANVTKDVEILLGDVIANGTNSNVYLENSSIGGNLTLKTGAGVDQVTIETFNSYGAMSIAKITTIHLGDGDDSLSIGGSIAAGSNNLVRFLGNITVDGGAGTNTQNDIFNDAHNFFAPKITKTLDNFV